MTRDETSYGDNEKRAWGSSASSLVFNEIYSKDLRRLSALRNDAASWEITYFE